MRYWAKQKLLSRFGHVQSNHSYSAATAIDLLMFVLNIRILLLHQLWLLDLTNLDSDYGDRSCIIFVSSSPLTSCIISLYAAIFHWLINTLLSSFQSRQLLHSPTSYSLHLSRVLDLTNFDSTYGDRSNTFSLSAFSFYCFLPLIDQYLFFLSSIKAALQSITFLAYSLLPPSNAGRLSISSSSSDMRIHAMICPVVQWRTVLYHFV